MIKFSANVSKALRRDTIESFYLLRISNKGNTVFASTTFYADIVLSDGHIYRSNSSIISADPPQLSTSIDREIYKVAMADDGLNYETYAGYIGKTLETRIGFVDAVTKQPYLNTGDTIVVYRGRIDSINYVLDSDEIGSSVVELIGSSPMGSLDMKKSLYLSREAVNRRNPKDTSCDQVYEGSGSIVLKWGKK